MINILLKIWLFIKICFSIKIYFPVFILIFCISIYSVFINFKQNIKYRMVELAINKNGIDNLTNVTEREQMDIPNGDGTFGVMIDEYRWNELKYPVKWSDISLKKVLLEKNENFPRDAGLFNVLFMRYHNNDNHLSFLFIFLIVFGMSLVWPFSIFLILFPYLYVCFITILSLLEKLYR